MRESTADTAQATWTVIVPLRTSAAKSRLGAPATLAAAMSSDCLDAVDRCPAVSHLIVVVAGPVGALPRRARVLAQPDNHPGLRAAIGLGLQAASARPTAVLLGDLPALTPDSLALALADGFARLRATTMAFHVPDADGTGTVLLGAAGPDLLPVRFGPHSGAAHTAAGSVPVAADARLRRDVDTAADLWQAWSLGVGPATRATLAAVQVSVLSYDPATRSGWVVTDDGVRLELPASALTGSDLRLLRPGQRLSALLTDTGQGGRHVSAVRLAGIGTPLPTEGAP